MLVVDEAGDDVIVVSGGAVPEYTTAYAPDCAANVAYEMPLMVWSTNVTPVPPRVIDAKGPTEL